MFTHPQSASLRRRTSRVPPPQEQARRSRAELRIATISSGKPDELQATNCPSGSRLGKEALVRC